MWGFGKENFDYFGAFSTQFLEIMRIKRRHWKVEIRHCEEEDERKQKLGQREEYIEEAVSYVRQKREIKLHFF